MSEYLFKANFDIKNCLTCPVENMVVNCPCFTGEAFASDYTDSKHPNCPLVELPPHGILWDRDKIFNVFDERMEMYRELGYEDDDSSIQELVHIQADLIAEVETVIEAST